MASRSGASSARRAAALADGWRVAAARGAGSIGRASEPLRITLKIAVERRHLRVADDHELIAVTV
jgi:hypothetical protein